MGWMFLILLAAVTAVATIRFGRLPKGGAYLIGSALLVAAAGYAWQGRPGMIGSPTPPRQEAGRPDGNFARLRGAFMERFGSDADTLATADAFERQGLDAYAVGILKSALVRRPRSAALWTGLGNALTLHGDGIVSPAAELAYRRAIRLAPNNPAPGFFLGLAYLESGQIRAARNIWAKTLRIGPADAPWREALAVRLVMLDKVLAAGGR